MKGFKFKLSPLLKIRKLKEDQCKMEIGKLQKKLKELHDELQNQHTGISSAYRDLENTVENGATGLDLKFYPYFVQGKRTNIKILESKMNALDNAIKEKFQELAKLRADVKVIESMKEKHLESYKKEYNKKLDESLEEQVLSWLSYRGRS